VTGEQERVLVETVERLTVLTQEITTRAWEALGTGSPITRDAAELNLKLCEAFPFLKSEASR